MKTKKTIAIVFLSFTVLLAAYTAIIEEREWDEQVLHEDGSGFVQLEIVEGEPRVAYSTDDGIVLAERKNSGILSEGKWQKTNITSDGNSGFYLSITRINGELAMAHQYSGLGNRKLGYTHRVNGSWVTDQADSVTGTGIEPGMYASLSQINSDPVIFYHTAEGDKFVKARKSNGTWKREILDRDTGQFIASDGCGDKVYVLYRSRDSSSLSKGVLTEDEWSSQELEGDTGAAMSVDATKCEFRGAFHNTETGMITYLEGEEREQVREGKSSRISLDYRERPRISYYLYGSGLFYASSDEGWKSQAVDQNRNYAGERNEIETYTNGDPGIAYTTGSSVVYTEYRANPHEIDLLIKLIVILIAVSAVLCALFLEEELLMIKSKLFKQFRL